MIYDAQIFFKIIFTKKICVVLGRRSELHSPMGIRKFDEHISFFANQKHRLPFAINDFVC